MTSLKSFTWNSVEWYYNKSTCKCMIYGELGRPPQVIQIKQRMVNIWIKLTQGKDSKLIVLKSDFMANIFKHGYQMYREIL